MNVTSEWQARPAATLPSLPEIPEAVLRLLAARGATDKESIQKLLNPSLKSMKDPQCLDQLGLAVERLVTAYKKNECVAVYADFDLDGTSGLALLVSALQKLGYKNLKHYQPLRLSEGYGLHVSAVEELAASQVNVIVTVDVGVTALEAAQRAKDLSVDLIITDHHLPKGELPNAYALVNPNKGTCNSQLGHLSGVGVAFYLVIALKKQFEAEGLLQEPFDLKSLLDCFVIGTLTDMVPLKEENRVLVKHGLLQLERTQRPGLRALMRKLGLDERVLTSQDVALQLAPKLNALSRMEMGLTPREVFLVETHEEAEQLVEKIIENNELRKHLQKEALEEARAMAEEQRDWSAVFVYSKNFHKGVIGLIATQLAKDFSRPAFVGSLDEESGQIHGSARLPDASAHHLVEILTARAGDFLRAGGHQAAAGFVTTVEKVTSFIDYIKEGLSQSSKSHLIEYDTDVTFADLDTTFMHWYSQLEPFGKDFPVASLCARSVKIVDKKILKGAHLKLSLQQKGKSFDGIYFSAPASLHDLSHGSYVDLLFEPSWNHFRGERRLQLLIKDIRPV